MSQEIKDIGPENAHKTCQALDQEPGRRWSWQTSHLGSNFPKYILLYQGKNISLVRNITELLKE